MFDTALWRIVRSAPPRSKRVSKLGALWIQRDRDGLQEAAPTLPTLDCPDTRRRRLASPQIDSPLPDICSATRTQRRLITEARVALWRGAPFGPFSAARVISRASTLDGASRTCLTSCCTPASPRWSTSPGCLDSPRNVRDIIPGSSRLRMQWNELFG